MILTAERDVGDPEQPERHDRRRQVQRPPGLRLSAAGGPAISVRFARGAARETAQQGDGVARPVGPALRTQVGTRDAQGRAVAGVAGGPGRLGRPDETDAFLFLTSRRVGQGVRRRSEDLVPGRGELYQ